MHLADAGDTALIPHPGRFHIHCARATKQPTTEPCSRNGELELPSPCAATTENLAI